MISFPVVPAAPALPGAPAAPGSTPGVPPAGAFDFVDLLKQLTANVAAPVDVIAPADADSDAPTAAPAKTVARCQEKKDEQKDTDPTGVAPVVIAPITIAPQVVVAPKNATPTPSTPAPIPPDLPASAKATAGLAEARVGLDASEGGKVGPTPGITENKNAKVSSPVFAQPEHAIAGQEQSPAPATTNVATKDTPPPVVSRDPVVGPTFRSGVQDPATGPIQNTPFDINTARRDSNSNSNADRRSLDAIAPRAAAAAPAANAPAFQVVTTDVRPLLVNTAAPATLSSSTTMTTLTAKDTADIPQQIVQAMRMQWNNGVGDARITLKPEYLGDVTISIRVDRGEVAATLQASAPEVRQWIESHESTLRQMLSDRGLRLDELAVTDVPEERQTSDEDGRRREAEEPPQQPRRRAAATATFEVIA